jgi:D-glycero-D-manno-heptose 1,7-bisphosphate phosphatase
MKIDNSWTLFLDRDGVINKELRNDYVKKYEDFHFEEGALEAIQKLSSLFGLLIIITNQRGVGAGLMSVEDLNEIHEQMTLEITNVGGRIDKIYFAPDEDRQSVNRKPNPTMAYKAKADFPQIDFSKTMMVGNSSSDMEFGRKIGAYTVYIDEKQKYDGVKTDLMDEIYDSLNDFAKRI